MAAGDARQYFNEGVDRFRSGDYPAAERNFRRAMELGPARASVLTNLAGTLLAQGKAADAIGFAERAVQLDGAGADAWFVLGRCRCEVGDARALECFERAVQLNPNFGAAWYQRALILQQLHRVDESLACANRVIGLEPDHLEARAFRVDLLLGAGRYHDALDECKATLALAPGYGASWFQKGRALNALARNHEAMTCYREAVRLDPSFAPARMNLGVTLCFLGRHAEGLACFDAVLSRQPGNADAWLNRGLANFSLRRVDQAVADYEHGLAAEPDNAELWFNRGVALAESGGLVSTSLPGDRPAANDELSDPGKSEHRAAGEPDFLAEALRSYEKAIALRPDYLEAWQNHGNLLFAQLRYQDACASHAKALAIDPDHAESHWNLGLALRALGRNAESLRCFETLVRLQPRRVEAWMNRGVLHFEERRYEEACASYAKALEIDPDHAASHWNEAQARLLLGEFEIGWKKYSYRWRMPGAWPPRFTDKPLMRLDDAGPGSRILLWHDQGYGDTLQFCRYAPLMAQRGAEVSVLVQVPLRTLLGSLGAHRILARGDNVPDFDFQAPLSEMPRLFGTTQASIPASPFYLSADPQRAAWWSERLPARGRELRLGICCSGSADHSNDRQRSMPLAEFTPLCDHAKLFLIQKDVREADLATARSQPRISVIGEQLADFSETAAVVANLDLVISVDTSVAHLAGALGKPVWILLPWAAEWRWMLDRTDSPWYPTARLFRQDAPGDWSGVIRKVVAAMAHFMPA